MDSNALLEVRVVQPSLWLPLWTLLQVDDQEHWLARAKLPAQNDWPGGTCVFASHQNQGPAQQCEHQHQKSGWPQHVTKTLTQDALQVSRDSGQT